MTARWDETPYCAFEAKSAKKAVNKILEMKQECDSTFEL